MKHAYRLIWLTTVFVISLSSKLFGQCTGTFQYPAGAVTVDPGGALTSINGQNWAGDYSVVTGITSGEDYELTITSGYFITVRQGSNAGPVLGQGVSPVTVTAANNGDLYVSWHTNSSCGTATVDQSTTVQCLTCSSVGGIEYINFYPWTNGATSATNWQSDPDINEFGVKTGCIFADITVTNTGPWYTSSDPSWSNVAGDLGFETHANWTNTNQQIVFSITFKNSGGSLIETPCSFNIHDLNAALCGTLATPLANAGLRFIDVVNILGYKSDLTTTVNPIYTNVCTGNVVTGNTIRGTDDCGSNQLGVSVSFSSAISRFVLTYSSGTGSPGNKSCPAPWNLNPGENPKDQYVQLSPLTLNYDCNSPLPVELVNFSVLEQERSTVLDWQTASERNSDYFVVQRISTEPTWSDIAQIQSKGNSSEVSTYRFEDRDPELGVSYYRLKQVDLDGSFQYSNVLSSQRKGNYRIFPNPSTGIILFNDLKEDSQVIIMDMSGATIEVIKPLNNQIDLSALASGLYLISSEENGIFNEKIVLQK